MSIEIKNVSKSFGSLKAVDHVSLTFEEEKIYGLLGRNGAGKSTLLNLITNRIFPDEGEVFVNGAPAKENDAALRNIYFMSEGNLYPDSMKVMEAFHWTKEFYGGFDEELAKRLSDKFQLPSKKKIKSLSTGYRSIFKIIVALSVDASYILLDEPVLGLDANHRELFYKELIESYGERPRTFVISTHLIEEISGIIEDIIIIKQGKVIRNESTENLLQSGYTVSGSGSLVDRFISGKHVIGEDVLGGLKSVYILGETPKEVPAGLEVTRLDLQKLFIQLTNE